MNEGKATVTGVVLVSNEPVKRTYQVLSYQTLARSVTCARLKTIRNERVFPGRSAGSGLVEPVGSLLLPAAACFWMTFSMDERTRRFPDGLPAFSIRDTVASRLAR